MFSILWFDTSAGPMKVTNTVELPMARHPETQPPSRKEFIPIGIKVCTIYLNPWKWPKIVLHYRRRRPLVWALTLQLEAIQHIQTEWQSIGMGSENSHCRKKYHSIESIIRILRRINICLSQLLTHLIWLSKCHQRCKMKTNNNTNKSTKHK